MPEGTDSIEPDLINFSKEAVVQTNLSQRIDALKRILSDASPDLRDFLISEDQDAQSMISMLLGLKPMIWHEHEKTQGIKNITGLSQDISRIGEFLFDRSQVEAKLALYPREFPRYQDMITQDQKDRYVNNLIGGFKPGKDPVRIALHIFHGLTIGKQIADDDRQIGLLLGFPYDAVDYYTRGKGKEVDVYSRYGLTFGFPQGSQEVAEFSKHIDEAYQKVYTAIPELKHD